MAESVVRPMTFTCTDLYLDNPPAPVETSKSSAGIVDNLVSEARYVQDRTTREDRFRCGNAVVFVRTLSRGRPAIGLADATVVTILAKPDLDPAWRARPVGDRQLHPLEDPVGILDRVPVGRVDPGPLASVAPCLLGNLPE